MTKPCMTFTLDGQPAVLDRRFDVIRPGVCRGDCKACKDVADAMLRDIEPFIVPLDDPEAVLEASKKILEEYRLKEPLKLSVGDLSVVSEEKKKRDAEWVAKESNRAGGATVGDLSKAEDQRGFQELFQGGKGPEPCVSESQEVLMRMQRAQKKKREEVFKVKQIIFEQQGGE